MDLDGDGLRDVITGCWPGQLHLFHGTKDGLAASTPITFAGGAPIELGSASTVFAVDWDTDGDLDLLVGDIDGNVFLVANASGGKALEFQPAVALRAGGKPIEVAGDSGPVVADWDGDGRHDLLVGAGDGAVTWYRNLAREGAPLLARGAALLPASSQHGGARDVQVGPSHGMRTKVAVADWDEDGRLDLLVGDFSSARSEAPTLTPEQVKRRDELQSEQQKLAREWNKRFESAFSAATKAAGVEGDPRRRSGGQPADTKLIERLNQAALKTLEADGAFATSYGERMQALWKDLQPLMPSHETHGHVWLFTRQASGGAAEAGGGLPAALGGIQPAPAASAVPAGGGGAAANPRGPAVPADDGQAATEPSIPGDSAVAPAAPAPPAPRPVPPSRPPCR